MTEDEIVDDSMDINLSKLWVQSVIRELRSHKPHNQKKQNKTKYIYIYSFGLRSDMTYEIITYIEMPRILSEPRRGQFDRFIMPSCYIGTETK